MSLRAFYNKQKVKIIMITPILLGGGFFLFSTISALITVNNTEIPNNFDDVSLEISKYQIQQIDEKTNLVKWILKAETAEASSDEAGARILNPSLIYYEAGLPKFTIKSKLAVLNQKKQEIELSDNVILKTSDEKYTIKSGRMFFKESDDFIAFSDNWNIENDQGYTIKGLLGKVSKNFQTIISQENAKLTKGTINIYGDQIRLDVNSKEPIKASSNALLKISDDQELYANEIKISENGRVKAHNNVHVKTAEINCYSSNLDIEPNPDKSPKIAIFTGNPYIIQSGNSIYSDKIFYNFETKKASMEGRVHSGV